MQRSATHPSVATVIGVALLLAAVISFSAAANRFIASRSSRSWAAAEGVIIESRLHSDCTYCSPIINYRYVVNGQSFVGDHIVAGPQDYYSSRDAASKVSSYFLGRKVSLYYDSSNPATSCLEQGLVRGIAYALSIVGGCFLIAGLFLLWHAFRARTI
ncbi:MAG TPA: DUF3592 domain-containing protein [Pyrinomonadaceae bacterium]|jgi:hypothetical protein|nr:DUF3592 domain-containing protein [Pyrinomonadaceae bacterium]